MISGNVSEPGEWRSLSWPKGREAQGCMTRDWIRCLTVPIWKGKGDVMDCSTYRPVRLLSHTLKVFERVLDARLRDIIEITSNQCGFVKNCGTVDAIHAARLMLSKHIEKRKPLHMAFLDLEKAFDRVPHDPIWYALRKHHVPEAYVQCIQTLYDGIMSAVRCAAGTSENFAIRVGVHQGSALSPLLFNLCMDTITSGLQNEHPWTLLYADDVMLAAGTTEELQRQCQSWKVELEKFGMRLNVRKTDYMECGTQTSASVHVDDVELEKTTSFKYLGSRLSHDSDIGMEVQHRISTAWMKWRQVSGVLCDKKMPRSLKSKVYRSVVRPVAMYGCECWPSTGKHEQQLHAMEMKMLRWSLGISRLQKRTNEDVRSAMGVAPIQDKMRESRLRWFGHVMRSNSGSVVKRAFDMQVEGCRPRGRPKTRWMDRIEKDMASLQLRPRDAEDRLLWRRKVNAADPADMREQS